MKSDAEKRTGGTFFGTGTGTEEGEDAGASTEIPCEGTGDFIHSTKNRTATPNMQQASAVTLRTSGEKIPANGERPFMTSSAETARADCV